MLVAQATKRSAEKSKSLLTGFLAKRKNTPKADDLEQIQKGTPMSERAKRMPQRLQQAKALRSVLSRPRLSSRGIKAGLMTALAGIAIAVAATPANATVAFRQATNKPCSFCHATPGVDMVPLTNEGQRFLDNGYKLLAPAIRVVQPRPVGGDPSTWAPLNLASALIGSYVHEPTEHGWHAGELLQDANGLRWANRAGSIWRLKPDLSRLKLHTGPDNPYYARGWRDIDVVVTDGWLVGIRINGEMYDRTPAVAVAAPRPPNAKRPPVPPPQQAQVPTLPEPQNPQPPAEQAPTKPADDGSNQRALDTYLNALDYKPEMLLARQEGVVGIRPVGGPTTGRNREGGKVIVTTKKRFHLSGNLSDLLIFGAADPAIYPGSLLYVDQSLVEGKPREIVLPRAPITIFTTLPGLTNSKRTVTEVKPASVQDEVNQLLETWFANPTAGYTSQAAQSITSITRVITWQQASLQLGINAQWLTGEASSMVSTTSSEKKNTFVALHKQIFYTISIDPPDRPGGKAFAPHVTVENLKDNKISNEAPPGYISSVYYGRLFMIKIETDEAISETEVSASLKQKFVSTGTVNTNVRNSNASDRAKCTIIAIGGGADKAAESASGLCGGDQPGKVNLDGFNDFIKNGAVLRRDNPGSIIAYKVKFLKDGSEAVMGSSTDYTEVTHTVVNEVCVAVKHSAAYILNYFTVTWYEPTDKEFNGQLPATNNAQEKLDAEIRLGLKQKMTWNSGTMTAGNKKRVCMPADSGPVWLDADGKGISGSIAGFPQMHWEPQRWQNICYSMTGSLFKSNYDTACDANEPGVETHTGTLVPGQVNLPPPKPIQFVPAHARYRYNPNRRF
jgi:thiol-activated cytolysin